MNNYIYQAFLTPEIEGGYTATIPDLEGCFSEGDSFFEAILMISDAAKTYVSALMAEGEKIPAATVRKPEQGEHETWVSFEAGPSYVVAGDVVSAAQAARDLGVSAGRITHMLDAGLLDGYREGRNTYVTVDSITSRKKMEIHAGRPKKETALI